MTSLKKLLQDISDKPGLYIGKKSISRLFCFLQGLYFGNEEYLRDDTLSEQLPNWLKQQYPELDLSSWYYYYLKKAEGNDELAFDLLFNDLHKMNAITQPPKVADE